MAPQPKSRPDTSTEDNRGREPDETVPHTDTDKSGHPREPRQPGMGEDEEKGYEPEKERENLTR